MAPAVYQQVQHLSLYGLACYRIDDSLALNNVGLYDRCYLSQAIAYVYHRPCLKPVVRESQRAGVGEVQAINLK